MIRDSLAGDYSVGHPSASSSALKAAWMPAAASSVTHSPQTSALLLSHQMAVAFKTKGVDYAVLDTAELPGGFPCHPFGPGVNGAPGASSGIWWSRRWRLRKLPWWDIPFPVPTPAGIRPTPPAASQLRRPRGAAGGWNEPAMPSVSNPAGRRLWPSSVGFRIR